MADTKPVISVLVIEDNPHMRAILKQVLKEIPGVAIREAATAADAEAQLASAPVDLIITDILMPGEDGVALSRRIRAGQTPANRFMPIMVITGHCEPSRVLAARDAGVNEVLCKPVTATGVMTRLKAMIESPRPFISSPGYFGPCRRRKTGAKTYAGPPRRKTDPGFVATPAGAAA